MDQNRSEAVNLMNFRIDKAFPLGGARKATLMLDIYNLLNADPVTNFNLSVDLAEDGDRGARPAGLPDGLQIRVLRLHGSGPLERAPIRSRLARASAKSGRNANARLHSSSARPPSPMRA